MNDAVLHLGAWVDAFDCFGETFEAIDTSDQDILDTPVVQNAQHTEPVMSTFLIRQIQA